MARAAADKPYVNFSNGLVTEVTKLNYPENSLLDVENMDIDIDGSVRRRLGLEPEVNAVSFSAQPDTNTTTHIWKSPGGDDSLEFLVVQQGRNLYIRNPRAVSVATTASIAPFSITFYLEANLAFSRPGEGIATRSRRLAQTRMKSASGFGCLFMFSPDSQPFYLDYNRDTKEIKLQPIGVRDSRAAGGSNIRIRDFMGVNDYLAVDEEPTKLTMNHLYNLMNQGFPVNWAKSYFDKYKRWPSNAQQAVLGKDAEDNFTPEQLRKSRFGNSPAPKGAAIYNARTGSRDNLFGARGLTAGTRLEYFQGSTGFTTSPVVPVVKGFYLVERNSDQNVRNVLMNGEENQRPTTLWSCGAFFSGRLWLSGDNNKSRPNGVYYSKIIQKVEDAGEMLQENDPTSEVISDLLDSDGGVLYIQEADGILDLIPLADGIVVLARKGVWFIRGSDSGFRATDFGVDKISDIQCDCPYTTVQADDAVYFLTSTGVHGVGFADGGVGVKTLSDERIFSFFQKIPREAKEQAYGVYDRISKKVFWFYREDETGDYTGTQTLYNKALILDARSGAFTKYSFPACRTGDEATLFGIVAAIPRYVPVTTTFTEEVEFDGQDVFFDAAPVMYGSEQELFKDEKYINNLKLVVADRQFYQHFICDFKSIEFRDFAIFAGANAEGKDYPSFLVTQPESLGDLQRDKQATYVHSYFKRTERLQIGGFLGATLDRPSSAFVQGQWDWHLSNAGNRFSNAQQAYRFQRPVIGVSNTEAFDNGEEVVYTKRKIRGKGRALSLRYEAEPRKDMHLLGISVAMTSNGV